RIRKVAPHRRLSPAFVEALADQKPDTEKPETATDDSWNTPDNPGDVMPF
ncbi:hypothetical protein ABIE21_002904, partial [Conyzicola nivalis]